MKKIATIPQISIIRFDSSDIIVTSNTLRQGEPIRSGETVQSDAPQRYTIWE